MRLSIRSRPRRCRSPRAAAASSPATWWRRAAAAFPPRRWTATPSAHAPRRRAASVSSESPRRGALRGPIGPGEVVRIFTGAPCPRRRHDLIQEDAEAFGDTDHPARAATATPTSAPPPRLRRRRARYRPRRLSPVDLPCGGDECRTGGLPRRPVVALIATGTNSSCRAKIRGPARSSPRTGSAEGDAGSVGAEAPPPAHRLRQPESLAACLRWPKVLDLIVTLGGASVATSIWCRRRPWPTAWPSTSTGWRAPGKPLMTGRLGGIPLDRAARRPSLRHRAGRLFSPPPSSGCRACRGFGGHAFRTAPAATGAERPARPLHAGAGRARRRAAGSARRSTARTARSSRCSPRPTP